MRPLILHVSALNDAEYAFYTASLIDLAVEDGNESLGRDYDSLCVGVREARAWFRGRFSSLSTGDIDAILKLFYPNLGPTDILTSGQFFAALRLIIHLESGKELDPALAFVQAYPTDASSSRSEPPRDHNGHAQSFLSSTPAVAPNIKRKTNPFSHDYLPTSSSSSPPNISSDTATPSTSHNPFIARAKSLNLHNPLSVTLTKINSPGEKSTPPLLPPRKPPIVPPPRHGSSVSSTKASNAAASGQKTSALMQQSLQASKAGQSMKKAEEMLEKERVLQVLKSSVPGAARTRSISPPSSRSNSEERPIRNVNSFVPPLPRRRNPSLSTSLSSGSLQSYEQVAGAHLSRHESPQPMHTLPGLFRSGVSDTLPIQSGTDVTATTSIQQDPASFVDSIRADGNGDDSPRIFRSQSMHHPSPPPRPPPRHRRPESVQLPTASPTTSRSLTSDDHSHRMSQSNRHPPPRSLNPPTPAKDQPSPLSVTQIQKAFEKLQTKAQPTFDKARYKAEAGLSKRGFVRVGEEGQQGLMEDQDPAEKADSGSSEEDDGEQRREGQVDRSIASPRDAREWEGWKPL